MNNEFEAKLREKVEIAIKNVHGKPDLKLTTEIIDEIMYLFDDELPNTVVLQYENFQKGKETIADLLDCLVVRKNRRKGQLGMR